MIELATRNYDKTGSMRLFRTHFKAMGCNNEIVAAARYEADAKQSMERAAREVLRIEKKYSRYRTDGESIVHRINTAAGTSSAVECDPETIELLQISKRLHFMSGGLFDITSGVLRRAWDFNMPVLPSRADLAPLLFLIGWDKVELKDHTIRLPLKGMEIDFGGFGKEYATDRAAEILAQNGIKHGYVNLGGDIKAFGGQPDGSPWLFGVKDPRDANAAVAQIAMQNGGLATSGDYEKFMEVNGVRYCHILNPFSGFPVNCWRSVSVSGVSALKAGAMSTIAMLKEAAAVQFLEESNCGYLFIDVEGRQKTNSPFNNAEKKPCQ